MRLPVVVVVGVDPGAMASAVVGLQFDLPGAVSVRHRIDVEREVLVRTVADVTGVLEHEEVQLAHACVSCAVREDVLPTLERLARAGRHQSLVAHLPVGAEASTLCGALAWDTRLLRLLRVSSVVAAVRADGVVGDLLGDDLLAERGHHCSQADRRGVGEVLGAMVEYADVVVGDGPLPGPAGGLLRALARPDVPVVAGVHDLAGATVLAGQHAHSAAQAWTAPERDEPLPPLLDEGVWRLDLRSPYAVHPERLLDSLEALGGGAHRSRGCFWLPTRPGRVLEWDGAGGQLSVGDRAAWGRRVPRTRIVWTGVGCAPAQLREAFDHVLLRPDEARGPWDVVVDGLEPWLGPIRGVA